MEERWNGENGKFDIGPTLQKMSYKTGDYPANHTNTWSGRLRPD